MGSNSNCKLESDRGVSRLVLDMQQLLQESKSADTVFFVGLKETAIPCHSFLLKQRCRNYRSDTQRYPATSPELFQAFLHYVYTGKLTIEESCLLDLLCLGLEFGMDDLEETCLELICSHIDSSPSKASALLTSTLSARTRNAGIATSLQNLINHCTRVIGESPAEFFQSCQFLEMPMETLVAVISSDQLCLEEEQVWRHVLKWAQFNAHVQAPLVAWNEQDRMKVAKFLTPVISHVRLLLIDSHVFAQEVEPTGCVPMALSLERYRYAALSQQQFLHNQQSRLIPRNCPKAFQSTIIKSGCLGKKLNEWVVEAVQQEPKVEVKLSWKCVFRGSLHGFSADAFHKHCDGWAPTIVVVQIENTKYICGGFSEVAWKRSKIAKYASSSKAFLFSFNGESEPVKYSVVKKHFAVCHFEESGPIFGAGADLFIASNCDVNNDSYSNLPHSYQSESSESDSEQAELSPTYNFVISDYEVFAIDQAQN